MEFKFNTIEQENTFFKYVNDSTIDIKDLFYIANIDIKKIFIIAIKYKNDKLLNYAIKHHSLDLDYEPTTIAIYCNDIAKYEMLLTIFHYNINRSFERAIELNSNIFINYFIDKIEPSELTIALLIKLTKNKDIDLSLKEKFLLKMVSNEKFIKNVHITNHIISTRALFMINLIFELNFEFDQTSLIEAFKTEDISIIDFVVKKLKINQ